MVDTLAIDGWGATFGTTTRGLGGLRPRPVPLAVPNATAHPSTASVPITVFIYSDDDEEDDGCYDIVHDDIISAD